MALCCGKRGQCHIDLNVYEEADPPKKDLTYMYTPDEQKKVGVCEENFDIALKYEYTLEKQREIVQMHGQASDTPWVNGLLQQFLCFGCKEPIQHVDGCDAVAHHKSSGGCGKHSYIARGNAHSFNNKRFKDTAKKLRKNESIREIEKFLQLHKAAANFWGLIDMLALIKKDPAAWLKEKEAIETFGGVHENLENMYHSLIAIAQKAIEEAEKNPDKE